MKDISYSSGRRKEGSSLLTVMLVLAASAVMVASVLTMTQTNARNSYRSRQMTSANYAAEALLERAFLIWQREMLKSPIGRATNAQLASSIVLSQLVPKTTENDKLADFTYPGEVNGVKNLMIQALAADGSPIKEGSGTPSAVQTSNRGTPAIMYRYRIVAFATASIQGRDEITMGVERTFTRRDDSLSMGVFLQDSAGIHPGDRMIFDRECQVHSNGTLYAAGYANTPNSQLQFQGPVSYVDGYVEGFPPGQNVAGNSPKSPVWSDGKSYEDSSMRQSQLKPSQTLKPGGIDPDSQELPDNANTTGGYREIIEAPKPGEDPYATTRIYNQADLVIEVNETNGSENNGKPSVTVTDNNGAPLSAAATEAVMEALKSPRTGELDRTKMYDRREQAEVDVTTVRLDALGDAIEKHVPGFNGVLYISDVSPSGSKKRKKGIRLTNGARLPGSQSSANSPGFTVASENAVYIQGDYNTDSRKSTGPYKPENLPSNQSTTGQTETSPGIHIPAAILADAVTVLSNNWNDANAAQYEPSERAATSTTIQASIVAGVSLVDTGTDKHIQGGAHNIIRFLEDWTGDTLTFNGSITQLYESQEFTGSWSVYPIYYPGTRRIIYDAGLRQRRPPGQPPITTFTRGEWRRL